MKDHSQSTSRLPIISKDKKVNAFAYIAAITVLIGTISSSIGTITQTGSDDLRKMRSGTDRKIEQLTKEVHEANRLSSERDERQERKISALRNNTEDLADLACEQNRGCPHRSWPGNKLTWEKPPLGHSEPVLLVNKPWDYGNDRN